MTDYETLHSEIPSEPDVMMFTNELLSSNPDKHYHLENIKDEVIKFFGISEQAANLKLSEYGFNGHGNDGTFLDVMVGWAVYHVESRQKTIKKVGPNTWAFHSNQSPTYIPRGEEARKRNSIVRNEIVPSIKILKTLQQYQDRDTLILSLSDKWDIELVEQGVRMIEEKV